MIQINKKSDIIIPFNKIGENNWAIHTGKIITSLAENWNDNLAKPIQEEDFVQLEKRLSVSLPNSLKLFYKTFGIANIGEELQAFDEIEWLKNIWTDENSYPYYSEEDKKVIPHLITFSNYLGNGNMFCFHAESHKIYYFDHDTQPYITKLFDCIDDYIKGCLIQAQIDLFGEDVEQNIVEEWVEQILIELFGLDTVKKWLY